MGDSSGITAAAWMAAAAAMAGGAGGARAQESGPPGHPTAPTQDAACPICGGTECCEAIDGSLVLTATTHYFFRGLIQEDQGLIFQPSLTLATGVWHGDGAVSDVGFSVNSWNSLHSGPTGSSGTGTNSPSAWYESDFAAGLDFTFRCGTTLSATWVEYTSPNSLFDTTSELDFVVAFDDAHWWGGELALSPSVTFAVEVDGQSDQNGGQAGTDEGRFLGFGIAPEFEVGRLGASEEAAPLTLSIPVNVGFSLGDYYEDASGDDDRFGYADAGLFLSFPLEGVSPHYGEWTLTVGTQLVFLNGNQEELNHGQSTEWTGTMALSIGF